MRGKSLNLEILLVSLAVILLEINYTRVFSFKLYYYFTYLIIGISMLGLGAGGVFVTVSRRLGEATVEKLIPSLCLVGAIAAPAGYLVVAVLQVNTGLLDESLFELVKLVAVCLAVFVPFLVVGIMITSIFGARPDRINRLYFADLVGAAIGCAISVPLLIVVTPPGSIVLAGAVLAVAGLRLAAGAHRPLLAPLAAVAAVLVWVAMFPGMLPDPVPDKDKTLSPQFNGGSRRAHSEWSPVFRVDLIDIFPEAGTDFPKRLYLAHDGMLGASMMRFDGDLETLTYFDEDTRASAFAVAKEAPSVLIIGAAAGHEILASLYFGASSIRGVELNPVTYSLLKEHFVDYTGGIANHEKVDLVNYEGRTFLERDQEKYDLIWFVAPDSYSAMNAASSGAFVLSESYLYTTEMIQVALAHLAPGGLLSVQFGEIDFANKPNRTARYLTTARDALQARGIEDFRSHVLLSTVPEFFTMATILIKNEPFTAAEAWRFAAHETRNEKAKVWHAAGHPIEVDSKHPVRKVIDLEPEQLAIYMDAHPYQLHPVTDNKPFFWHFARFQHAFDDKWGGSGYISDPEDATGERVLVILLLFAMTFAAVFLLLPLIAIRDLWHEVPHKLQSGTYFAALGLGFMFFEVSLMQQMTLFLGYPTYSLTVTLFSLLIFTGIGSLATERYAQNRNRSLAWLLCGLVGLMLTQQYLLEPVVDHFIVSSLTVRIVVAILFIAPLGLCLGAFMPIGLGTVSALSEHPKQYIAWAWAVNGFFSVMSSILATILSMTFGFQFVLMLGMGIYLIGVLSLMSVPINRD